VEFRETNIKPDNDETGKEGSDDKEEDCSPFGTEKNFSSAVMPFFGVCCRFMKKSVIKAVVNFLVDTWRDPKWLWRNPETQRLVLLKTALGMFFASPWM
jgi:hypothetical protein